jgi:hypothetical protein
MTDLRNFICWTDEAVLATTPRDAASLGDGHFQAIHHPFRLRRRRIDERAGGHWVSEHDVVQALRGALRPDGYLLMPIVGGSGTGKSHLVRWVKDQTQSTPEWETRYLPKNRTGIRRAIEIIIRDLAGPRIDEAREALEGAPAHSEADDVLAERLLDELALLVSHLDDLPAGGPASTDPKQQQLRRKLERQLPDVLRDPVVRRKLVEPGAVVTRLVGLAVRGRQEGDGLDDDATHFLSTDLPLTFEEIGDASRGARALLGQLATIPDLLEAAVSLINEALPLAEKRVSVSGTIDLVEVLRDVRRELLSQGKELVLFIEELTVLHGVEREFLDAIVEPARSDEGDMCNLRVIFAVTEGHFDDLDTVRTRCEDAYWLDTPYGEDGVDHDEALSFLGRYLNSTRLEPKEVEQSWQQRHNDHWLANACTPCPHRVVCHDTFGTSTEGYGLYPLNPAAAGRFVEALSRERFDPRDVVRELINRFLLQGGADMRQSAFPSDVALSKFDRETDPLPPLLAAELRNLRPTDHERVANTLRYWSDEQSPTIIREATLTAFGIDDLGTELPALGQLGGPTRPVPQPSKPGARQGEPETASVESHLRAPWRSHFAELSQWAGGNHNLSAKANNDLRNLVHKTLLENLEVGATPLHLGPDFSSTRFRAEPHIGIAGTVTQQNLDAAIIVIEQDETNAAALQGLILSAHLDAFDFPQAANFRRRLADSIEVWTSRVVAALTVAPSPAVISAVEGLLVAATVLGDAAGARAPADYLDAMFRANSNRVADTSGRGARWTALVAQASALAPRLRSSVAVEFGESRGTGIRGGIRAIQADCLLPLVEAFTAQWRLDSDDASIAPLMRAVAPAVDEEWTLLGSRASGAAPHVDRDRSWQDQMDKTLTVLRTAHNAGRLRDITAIDALATLSTINPERVVRSFLDATALLARESDLHERLAVLASHVPSDVTVVHAFTTRAAAAIDGVERDLEERQAASGGATNVEDVASRVLAATSRFADAVKGLST